MRSMVPPNSGITYWQVEHASSIVDGKALKNRLQRAVSMPELFGEILVLCLLHVSL